MFGVCVCVEGGRCACVHVCVRACVRACLHACTPLNLAWSLGTVKGVKTQRDGQPSALSAWPELVGCPLLPVLHTLPHTWTVVVQIFFCKLLPDTPRVSAPCCSTLPMPDPTPAGAPRPAPHGRLRTRRHPARPVQPARQQGGGGWAQLGKLGPPWGAHRKGAPPPPCKALHVTIIAGHTMGPAA